MYALPYLAVAFIAGIIVASGLWKRRIHEQTELPKKTDRRKFPLKKVDAVLSDFERSVYRTLQHEVGSDYCLFPKVRLEYIVTLSRKSKREQFYHNLLKSRQVDLLMCEREKLVPFMAIQILAQAEQDDAEELTAHLIRSADIPCLQLPVKKSFAPNELISLVRQAVKDRQRNAMLAFHDVKRKG